MLADDQVLHLLRRATFGPTNEVVAWVQDRGVDAWLDEQLAPESIDDSACEQRLGRFPMLDRSARQINDTDRDQGGQQRADDAKTLVVLFLRGGIDGLNVCIPHGDPVYYDKRPTSPSHGASCSTWVTASSA